LQARARGRHDGVAVELVPFTRLWHFQRLHEAHQLNYSTLLYPLGV
jgi:hypothetical protein